MVMKSYPPQFKADAVTLYESRPEATIRQLAADSGIDPATLRNWVRAAGVSRPRGRRAAAPAEPSTPLETENTPCARRSANWKRNGRSRGRRPSISPGRRAGEPLPVRRRPPAPLRRQAAVRHPRHRPLQLLLLARNSQCPGSPASGRRSPRRPDTGSAPRIGRHPRRPQDHRRVPEGGRVRQPQAHCARDAEDPSARLFSRNRERHSIPTSGYQTSGYRSDTLLDFFHWKA